MESFRVFYLNFSKPSLVKGRLEITKLRHVIHQTVFIKLWLRVFNETNIFPGENFKSNSNFVNAEKASKYEANNGFTKN